MAHNLASDRGMVYTGATPWHGLGVKLDNAFTWEEAYQAVPDFHFTTEAAPVEMAWPLDREVPPGMARRTSKGANLPFVAHESLRVVRRADTGLVFGTATKAYKPIDNRTAGQFFDAVVGAGAAIYETAGVLGDGERIWILAKLPVSYDVVAGDTVNEYVLLHTGHKPGMAFGMKRTSIRVVCANTLSAAVAGGDQYRRRHTSDLVMSEAINARTLLQLTKEHAEIMQQTMSRLAQGAWDAADQDRLARHLLGVGEDVPARDLLKNQQQFVVQLGGLFTGGIGQDIRGVAGTRWAALNAVTQYVDHEARYRVNDARKAEYRLEQAWFGTGAAMKQNALDYLVGVK